MERSIRKAIALFRSGEIDYQTFVKMLAASGVERYTAHIPSHSLTYRKPSGETFIEEVPSTAGGSVVVADRFDESAVKAAVDSYRKGEMDYGTFLQKISAAGVLTYEVDIRENSVTYRGKRPSYVEYIPDNDG